MPIVGDKVTVHSVTRYSFDAYSRKPHYMPGSVLGTRNARVERADATPILVDRKV